MKRILRSLLVLLMIVGVAGCGNTAQVQKNQENPDTKQIRLGIIQIVEHPALDAAREGFLDNLAAKGYKEGQNLVGI